MCSLIGRLAACHRFGTNITREVLVHIETDKAVHVIGEEQAL